MTAQILVRSATTTDIRFDRREIDVLAVPYGVATAITDQDGRYDETIAAGAFGKVSTRASQVKVLRDHHPQRAVGRCLSIDDAHPAGLHATMRISPTELGDETLTLADDGVLDVSVGFTSKGGDRWSSNRSAVVRTNCWLYEISLVPMPAYESARVLAVRDGDPPPAPPPDPLIAEIRAMLLEMRYGPGRHPD